jgi:hypothetical protein
MFVRNHGADTEGLYLVADVDLIPRFLVSTFGEPGMGDGVRVSGEYVFTSENCEVFTVHDYKSTTLWDSDPSEGLPTPEEFWSSSHKEEMSLGSKDGHDYRSFLNWLLEKQDAWSREQS